MEYVHSSERSLSVLRSKLSACTPNTAFHSVECTHNSVFKRRVSRCGRFGFDADCARCVCMAKARSPTCRPIEPSNCSKSVWQMRALHSHFASVPFQEPELKVYMWPTKHSAYLCLTAYSLVANADSVFNKYILVSPNVTLASATL